MNFWTGKRICVTGGANLIGSHLCEKLIELGVGKLVVIDDLSSGKKEYVPKDAQLHIHDLRNYDTCRWLIRDVDTVFHLASVHGGRGFVSGNHEVEISDNFVLSTNVIKASAKNKVERVAFSSSACAYDIRKQQNYDESIIIPESWDYHDTELFPDGMYGLEKAVTERVLRTYIKSGLLSGVVCRFFTVMGKRIGLSHFIGASIAKSFVRTDPFYIWGTGNEYRNFTPVQNIVDGLLLATEKSDGGIYNIGSERRMTINQALEIIWEKIEWRPKEIIYQPNKPVGVKNRISDSTKAKTQLGWVEKVSFEQSIDEIIDWFCEKYTVTQLKNILEDGLVNR